MAVLTEDQSMLRDMAQSWARERAPIAQARRAWEGRFPAGYDPADWVDRAIRATRKAVFPFHGIEPEW